MIHVKNSTEYYINERALTFSENDLENPDRVSVSLVSGAVIMVYIRGTIDYAADGNYEKWKLTGYPTKLATSRAYNIYARLERESHSALIVFSVNNYHINGQIVAEDGTLSGKENERYYYIKIGELTESTNGSDRTLTYDSGILGTKKGDYEAESRLDEMFELDKVSSPWLIKVKQFFHEFTVKKAITLLGGLIFSGNQGEKRVTDIKRSVDSDVDVPVSDENVATSKYVQSEVDKLDNRFLSKIGPDSTDYHVDLLGGITTTEAKSKDFAEGTVGAGWGAKKNDKGEYVIEADQLVARVLGRIYDLFVENGAVFSGNLTSKEFVSGFTSGRGWSIRLREETNASGETEKKSIAEFDEVIVRGAMRIYELIVSQLLGENDNRIFTGMMEVDHYDESDGKVYLSTQNGRLYNPFRVDDIIIVQQYGGLPSEGNGYRVTKQYEFVVTGVGIGETQGGEERMDWLTFRSFSTPIEGGGTSLITKGDTLVRIDNETDLTRKGIVQIMSVGENTPYIDMVYGAKTDPDNSLKGRLGNISGIYNPLFGWLKEFGAYLINLYAVGEFRIAHTGEDVADAIEIAKGQFRTNYRQVTFDLTDEDNFFTNASFTNNCEGWILGEDTTSYFLVDDLPQFFNYELYGSEDTFAGIAEYNGRDMLRLSSSTLAQVNDLIKKPGTHKEYTGGTENEDGTYTKEYEEKSDTVYLSARFFCKTSGAFEFGFVDSSGTFIDNVFHHSGEYTDNVDAYTVKLSGTWDGVGDFAVRSSGDIYIDLLSLTDKPLDNFMIETSTSIEQDAERISLLGKKVNGVEGSVTELGIELDAANERIQANVSKISEVESSVSTLTVGVEEISTKVASAQGTADNAQKAADAAQQAANDATAGSLAALEKATDAATDAAAAQQTADGAVADAANAQKAADAANEKATANATAIAQDAEKISLIAAAFQEDGSGELKLTSAAGSVITSDMARIYATKDDVSAELATKVEYDPETGKVTSKIILSADQINLNGAVTFSMFSTDLQNDLNSKVSQEDVDESVKAITDGLGDLAYKDKVMEAMEEETIVVGGYLNTSLITVDEIKATKGTVGGFTISERSLTNINADAYLSIGDNSGGKFVEINYPNSETLAAFRNDDGTVISISTYGNTGKGLGIIANGDATAISSLGKSFITGRYIAQYAELVTISGLAVSYGKGTSFSGAVNPSIPTTTAWIDFIVATGNVELPSATVCPGKVIFVKLDGTYNISSPSPVYKSDGYSTYGTTDGMYTDTFSARSLFFISDGEAWYEFTTYHR